MQANRCAQNRTRWDKEMSQPTGHCLQCGGKMNLLRVLAGALWMSAMVQAEVIEIASLKELAEYAAQSGNTVRMKPGVYRMTDYLTDEVIAEIRSQVPQTGGRPPVWMIQFSGNDNHF